jgi:tetratricopeptide (TPR) repeat protein
MRRLWTRTALVIALAATALIGAGIALGPLRHTDGGPPGVPAPAAQVAAGQDLDGYVARTTAHLTRVPGDWQAWAQLGMAHIQLARITFDPAHDPLAEAALRRSLAVRPAGNAAALTGFGALSAARHDFRAALRYALKAVAADPYSADAYGVLTDAHVELGHYPQATDAVQRMLDLRPDTGSYARASYLFELRGNTDRARELMQQSLGVAGPGDDTVFALQHLGELAFNAGDLDTAAGRYAEGLARRPGHPALLADRARVSAARGDLPAAIADLRTATATLPTIDHLAALSEALTLAGDTAGAARTDGLVRIATTLPGTTSSATDIDLVLFHADRGEAALAVTKGHALLATRPSVAVQTAYAWALHAAGRDREALKHADRGLRLGTRDARAHYFRGTIRLSLGDRAGARTDLAAALKINPHFSMRYGSRARAELATLDGAA